MKTARSSKQLAVHVAIACVALCVATYAILSTLGLTGSGTPSRDQLRELDAERAEIDRLAPPEDAPKEVRIQQGGAPG